MHNCKTCEKPILAGQTRVVRGGDTFYHFNPNNCKEQLPMSKTPTPTAIAEGNTIRQMRQNMNMSINALSKASGVNSSTISHLEKGKMVSAPSLAKLKTFLANPQEGRKSILSLTIPPGQYSIEQRDNQIMLTRVTPVQEEEVKALRAKVAEYETKFKTLKSFFS